MRWIPLVMLAAVVAITTASADGPDAPQTKLIDRVAIVVDGWPIFASDLERGAHLYPTATEAEAALIDDAFVRAEARDRTVSIDPDDVDRAIEEVKAANALDDAELDAALAEQHLTLADYRADIEVQLLRFQLRNVMFAGRRPVAEHDAAMAAWLAERRARAFIERPEPR